MENENKADNPQEAGMENTPAENNNAGGNNEAATEARTESVENSGSQADAAEKYENFAKAESIGKEDFPSEEPMDLASISSGYSSKKRFSDMLTQNKKKFAIAVAAVFLIIAAAGAIYMLGGKKNAETPSDGQNTIIRSSFEAMEGVKSYSYDGKVKFTYVTKGESSNNYDASFEAGYEGVSQKDEQGKYASYSDIIYNSAINAGEQKSQTSFGVESVSINDKEYLKLNDFSIKGAGADAKTAELENSLKGYEGAWYSASPEDNRKFFEKITDYFSLPASIGSASEINGKNSDIFSRVFSNPNVLKISKEIGEEKVGDVDTVHYEVELNSQEALKVAVEVIKMQKEQGGLDENGNKILAELEDNAENAGKLKEAIDYVLGDVNLEIWIGKNDNLIYRFRASGSFDEDAAKDFSYKLKGLYGDAYSFDTENLSDMDLNFDIDCTLSKFNVSEVREPSDTKDFKEVMDKFEAAGPISASVPSSAADTDGDGLSDEEEKIYGSDSQKVDTDGDGYKDGDEVRNGYDPIVAGSARLDYSKLNMGK